MSKSYNLYFPYPVKHDGMFSQRHDLILANKAQHAYDQNFTFRETLPDAQEMHTYFQLIAQNSFSEEYIGKLLTQKDSWKFVGAIADLDNVYKGLQDIVTNDTKRSYFMTNTAGHHANNQMYQLFCPLNQLFFIVEYLNAIKFFPNITWIDIDAHFGNGDKEIFDKYSEKMKGEPLNLSGISFQNDYQNVTTPNFKAINYDKTISPDAFLNILSNEIFIPDQVEYVLLFFGTDIFTHDYGDNVNLSVDTLPKIISFFEQLTENKTLIIVQTGGNIAANIQDLVDCLTKS